MAISLILTYTRGAWVGFCFGAGILMLMLLRKLSVRNFVLLVVFLIGIAVLISLFTAHITARSSYLAGAKMGSFGWRGMVWSINFDEFLNHPFRGFGIGSCGAIAKRRLGFIIAPHNEYLKLMVETGIFGVISYVTALVLLLRFSMRKYRENLGTKKGILASGLAAAIFSVMVVAFGDNLFDYDAVFSYFWFFVVVGYNLLRES